MTSDAVGEEIASWGIRHSGGPSEEDGSEEKKDNAPELSPSKKLQKNLATREKIDASFRDEKYLALDDLVEATHASPPNAFVGRRRYYEEAGVLPLIARNGNSEPYLLLGINFGDETKPVDSGVLKVTLDDMIMPFIAQDLKVDVKKNRAKIEYLLLNEKEFQDLKGMVWDENARKQRLKIAENDSDERAAYNAGQTYFSLLKNAIEMGASDIHIEALGNGKNRVRFRIDGVLAEQDYKGLSDSKRRSLVTVVKNHANLRIDERREPQDGVITLTQEEENEDANPQEKKERAEIAEKYAAYRGKYNFRVSTMPTNHGEKAVLRILKAGGQAFKLEQLNYAPELIDQIRRMTSSPDGLIIVTGPTGSGKTTTLYSVLNELNDGRTNITTIEDPIEINLPGINQTQVNVAKNYTFATAPRTFWRQDPDIILIGEMRDGETAKTAAESAKTGHLVVSTLHARDSIQTLRRLRDLGIDNLDLESCLLGVVSQRLVRNLCGKCKQEYDGSSELSEILETNVSGVNLYQPNGKVKMLKGIERREVEMPCPDCKGLGFRGRVPIAEVWEIGPEERNLIGTGHSDYSSYKKLAQEKGMKDLLHNGVETVLQGKTTFKELFDQAVYRTELVRRKDEVLELIKKYQK